MTNTTPTCLELIERGASQNASRVALIVGDKQMTFSEVNRRANQIAHALHEMGAVLHARVALLVNNGVHSVPLDFGCVKAGVNRVPLNSRLSLQEHGRMLEEANCQLLVFGEDLADRAAELQQGKPGLRCYGLGTALPEGRDLLAIARGKPETAPIANVSPDDVILTLYTSGTTGVLKAAQHTQGSYAAICRNVLLNLFPIGPEDSMPHSASLIHASGTFILPFWLRGARSVVLPGFVPASYLEAVEKYRVSAINLVPTMLQMLLEHPDIARRDFSSLKKILYGASPMPRAVINRAIERFGQDKFWQYYGQTEVPLCLTVLRPEDHAGDQLGACGRPSIDVEIRLVDDKDNPVAAGEPGNLGQRPVGRSRIFQLARSDLPDVRLRWLGTYSDVGVFDAYGFLHLRDRTSDMIISGGYNVYPREVEDALLTHAAVSEAAVVGAPDEKWVEAVVAFVVLKPDVSVSESELIQHVAGQIASYKKPHSIQFTSSVPKTAVGKLDRKVLRGNLAGT
jgi:acyl-CoA synthetase (AMP-forming)/AMP-acid ligase II